MAAWEFIDINQDAVNRNPDGTFRKKQLVCVVAAKHPDELTAQPAEKVEAPVSTVFPVQFTGQNSEAVRKQITAEDSADGVTTTEQITG